MPYFAVKDATGTTIYIAATGAGSTGDPYVPTHTFTNSLPAGTAVIGKVDQGTGGVSAWKVDGSAVTQPVSVSALPLPSGAATSAAQTSGNSSLSSIDGKVPALGQALAAASVPVVLPATQITTLTPPAAITGFATAAKQPALGTAGTPSADVISVQGVAGMTPIQAGGITAVIKPTATVSTTPAYTSGDVIGGKITLANAVRVSGGTAVLQDILIIDTSNQSAALQVLIFNADPTAATITDNAAFVFSTDISKLIRRITVAVSDYKTINSIAVASVSVGRVVKAASDTSLYAVLVADGSTPTYAATTAIQPVFGFLQD